MIDYAKIKTTRSDHRLIGRIASRAEYIGLFGIAVHWGTEYLREDLAWDLCVVHHVCPLDLEGLHDAEPGDFAHEICGIVEQLDRETGKFNNCFRPRFTL